MMRHHWHYWWASLFLITCLMSSCRGEFDLRPGDQKEIHGTLGVIFVADSEVEDLEEDFRAFYSDKPGYRPEPPISGLNVLRDTPQTHQAVSSEVAKQLLYQAHLEASNDLVLEEVSLSAKLDDNISWVCGRDHYFADGVWISMRANVEVKDDAAPGVAAQNSVELANLAFQARLG